MAYLLQNTSLVKTALLGSVWDRVKDWFRPESRKAKKHVEEHYDSETPDWNLFVARASNSEDFIKQLKRSKKAPEKDLLHAVQMAALDKGPTLGEVESESTPGVKYQVRKLPNDAYGCTCNDWRFKGSVNPDYECKHIIAHRKGLNKVAGFKDMSIAFFDELQKIRDAQHATAENAMKGPYADNARPYSNLLTQDEEPVEYNPRPAGQPDDPEVILGGSA
jgi:hypothetical protein